MTPYAAQITSRAQALVATSVDDCRSSLGHVSDQNILIAALNMAREHGQNSKMVVIERRLRALRSAKP
jgi:hypothetical protein